MKGELSSFHSGGSMTLEPMRVFIRFFSLTQVFAYFPGNSVFHEGSSYSSHLLHKVMKGCAL